MDSKIVPYMTSRVFKTIRRDDLDENISSTSDLQWIDWWVGCLNVVVNHGFRVCGLRF